MRDEFVKKILMLLYSAGIEQDRIKKIENELIILVNDYEIGKRKTEIVVRSEDTNRILMQRFLIAKTVSGRTDRTITYYKSTLISILTRIEKPVTEITADDIRYYLAVRQRKDNVSKTTANNELRVLKSFFSFLMAEELVTKNPCLKIDQIKREKLKKEAFTEMDVEKIRGACLTNRETAIIEILLSTGCRITELSQIRIDEIKEDRLIVHGKGQKDRTVYLNAKAQMAVKKYIEERKDDNPYLFCSGIWVMEGTRLTRDEQLRWYNDPNLVADGHMRRDSLECLVRKIGKRAGVDKTHPHRFRRTCATFALRRGMPIEQVSKMLGHESIDTTMVYLDLSEQELADAHKKYVV